jgi:hypothetical protein
MPCSEVEHHLRSRVLDYTFSNTSELGLGVEPTEGKNPNRIAVVTVVTAVIL